MQKSDILEAQPCYEIVGYGSPLGKMRHITYQEWWIWKHYKAHGVGCCPAGPYFVTH